jgi:hypothetical protein
MVWYLIKYDNFIFTHPELAEFRPHSRLYEQFNIILYACVFRVFGSLVVLRSKFQNFSCIIYFPIHRTCTAHVILLDFINIAILHE